MKTVRILILEDDLETLSVLLRRIYELEEKLLAMKNDIAVTVFSEYTQVEDYLNKIATPAFDVVLLDRDCKLGGSFHSLDMDKFGVEKTISISSVSEYNKNARKFGVTRVVYKDYKNLEKFSSDVVAGVLELIMKKP